MNCEKELKRLIPLYAPKLDLQGTAIPESGGGILLATLAGVESAFGRNNVPRFEPSYYTGGRTYGKSAVIRQLVAKYGKGAASSWGPFQIMFPVAWDLGFRGEPERLADPVVSIDLAVKYLNKYCLCWEGATLEDVADAYNSGSPWDSIIPQEYIDKFVRYYHNQARTWLAPILPATIEKPKESVEKPETPVAPEAPATPESLWQLLKDAINAIEKAGGIYNGPK